VPESATSLPSCPSGASRSSSWRDVVFAGPGVEVAPPARESLPLSVLASPGRVAAALADTGHTDSRSMPCNGAVTTAVVLGQCLFSGESSAKVIDRMWGQVAALNPRTVLDGPVTGQALSDARARLAPSVFQAVFEADATRDDLPDTPGLRTFGLVVTAVDSTVLDTWNSPANAERFGIPPGGRRPQVRLLTVIVCGTRRILAAACDARAVCEQSLFDRLVEQLRPGTLNLADRGFFSMARWQTASATGAELIWRVKNSHRSLPASHEQDLPDGSALVRLRESDGMLARRRHKTGDPAAPRLPDTLARLVEFTVTTRDQTGRKLATSRYRVLTTLLDHTTHPAEQIAAVYAERWQIELSYKALKSTLRGPGRPLRGQSPLLVEQEVWALLTVYNALVDQAVAAAVDLGVDPDEISFTADVAATRDHLAARPPCTGCGHRPSPAGLTAAITAAPRNRTDRHRTSPRTAKERATQRTRDVAYTIEITAPELPKAD